ncbi:pyridoxal phosphate-dependent aminotransferase [Limisalsivibrio acetivorans]|uniref:pyridoxal phosphate-dependent aminotransferase n=1 Tax=Limisalsivibrio acetivorans TaxID=1304888 RepID=UPI0003B2FEDA|nr:aminotransferase class I/II-fold pyridoxal phosphate-dependent enzyme [Limisalsivibrio acetivorans]
MDRLENVTPFIVMDIVRKAGEIEDAIHFEVGQPDISPSEKVFDALHEAIEKRSFPYTESLGIRPLREKIAGFYKNRYGVDVSPDRILLTVGTSGAFLIAYSILMNSGDRLAFTDPSYPCYKNFSNIMDIEPVMIPVDSSTNYQLTVDMLKEKENIKAVQISSPANPTGNIYTGENLKELTKYCDENGIAFISDEIYHGLVYEDEPEHTALELSDEAIVINGFSKYFCMPGIRLGWMIMPERLVRRAEIVMQNLFISAPVLSQLGAMGAFDEIFLRDYKEEYRRRRDYLYGELKEMFPIDAKPQGAFYIWADISEYSNDSYAFCMELLEETGVAVTPGVDFGSNETNKYIRFAYTRNIDHMAEGIRRLKEYLKNR